MRARRWGHPDEHGETLSILKTSKNPAWWNAISTTNYKKPSMVVVRTFSPSYSGGWGMKKNHLNLGDRGCSEQRSHHCPPACTTEQDLISNKASAVVVTPMVGPGVDGRYSVGACICTVFIKSSLVAPTKILNAHILWVSNPISRNFSHKYMYKRHICTKYMYKKMMKNCN